MATPAGYNNFTDIYGIKGRSTKDEMWIPMGCTLLDPYDYVSGDIAYRLNGFKSTGELTWYQLLGSDNSPVLTPLQDSESNIANIVYYKEGKDCQGQQLVQGYTNDMNFMGHSMKYYHMNELISCCNPQNFDYYHCTTCNKYFYDVAGIAEANNIIEPKAHRLQKYDKVYDCVKGGMLDHYYCEECHNSYSSDAEPETDKYYICHNHYESAERPVVPIDVVATGINSDATYFLNKDFNVNGETFVGGSEIIVSSLCESLKSDVYTFTWPDTKYVSFKYYVSREHNVYDRSEVEFYANNKMFLLLRDGSRIAGGVTVEENYASGSILLTGHKPGDKVTIKMTIANKNCRRGEKPLYFYFSLAERPDHVMRKYGGENVVGNVNTCLNKSSDAAHWHCMVCNGNFSDEAGENRIGTSKPHNFTGHHEGGYFIKGQSTILANGYELSFAGLQENHHAYIPEYWYCEDCHQNFASSNPHSDEARLNSIVQNAEHNLVSKPIDSKLSVVECECGYGKHYEYDADKAVITATDYDEENGVENISVSEDSELYPYAMIGVTKARTVTKNIKTEGYYMAQDKLWHATGSFNVNPYRAYLNYDYQPEEGPIQNARSFILVTDGITNSIGAIYSNGELMDIDDIYDLSGKKLNSLQKGINVIKLNNGSVKKLNF